LFATTHDRNAGEVERKLRNLVLFSPDPDHLRIRPQGCAGRLAGPTHKRLQEPDRIRPDGAGNGQKFKDIDAPLAAFIFGSTGKAHDYVAGERLVDSNRIREVRMAISPPPPPPPPSNIDIPKPS
jgi:hypothetical protein